MTYSVSVAFYIYYCYLCNHIRKLLRTNIPMWLTLHLVCPQTSFKFFTLEVVEDVCQFPLLPSLLHSQLCLCSLTSFFPLPLSSRGWESPYLSPLWQKAACNALLWHAFSLTLSLTYFYIFPTCFSWYPSFPEIPRNFHSSCSSVCSFILPKGPL